ncbi:MAG TPA: dTDP-4-dehydrorhamnose 3,5-epimerase [Acidobacteriota bacterium]
MIFSETTLKGSFLIEPERKEDHRGFFARTWCEQEFEDHGLNSKLVQCSVSYNHKKGTLRGMHFQEAPFEETKLVRCTKGEIFDAIIDLRPNSETFKKYFSVILNEENRLMLYIPPGFAHGFQTMTDNTEVFYQMSQFYSPEHSRGVRWNDPAFGIQWPADQRIIIDRDLNYPDFTL